MNTPTFNTIVGILEKDFRMSRADIHPESALGELGLDSLALMEFVFAVEDSFRLRIPEDRLDPCHGIHLAHHLGVHLVLGRRGCAELERSHRQREEERQVPRLARGYRRPSSGCWLRQHRRVVFQSQRGLVVPSRRIR